RGRCRRYRRRPSGDRDLRDRARRRPRLAATAALRGQSAPRHGRRQWRTRLPAPALQIAGPGPVAADRAKGRRLPGPDGARAAGPLRSGEELPVPRLAGIVIAGLPPGRLARGARRPDETKLLPRLLRILLDHPEMVMVEDAQRLDHVGGGDAAVADQEQILAV